MATLTLTLLGVGAMRSPRYAPAGLLVTFGSHRIMLDGGAEANPKGRLDAWLLSDGRCELVSDIRAQARAHRVAADVAEFTAPGLAIRPYPVVHTSHPTFGYLIDVVVGRRRIRCAWAPEFFVFPSWVAGVDLMFAEAASYARPIHFAGGVGGHMPALEVARRAKRLHVRRLVLAHIGRSSIRARDAGLPLPFGEWGNDGDVFAFAPKLTSPTNTVGWMHRDGMAVARLPD